MNLRVATINRSINKMKTISKINSLSFMNKSLSKILIITYARQWTLKILKISKKINNLQTINILQLKGIIEFKLIHIKYHPLGVVKF